MQQLIEYIVKSLVDSPDDVNVECLSEDEQAYRLHVAADDKGKVIGRKGRTAHAIRTLMSAAHVGDSDLQPSLEIVD